MKLWLAGIAAIALLWFAVTAQSADPQSADLNNDGIVNAIDLAIFAPQFLAVGTPDQCVNVYRGTPDAQGYTVKIGAPAGHPIFAGDVRLIPC